MENKENNDKMNRKPRGENWTQEEKDLFLEVMKNSAAIIENKKTDTNTNKMKTLEWVKVQKKLAELTGISRAIPQLKGFWRRSKLTAKKSVALHKKGLKATGNRDNFPSPPPEDLKILALCPTDFVTDENCYDSDAISQSMGQDEARVNIEDHMNCTIYDMDKEIDNQHIESELQDEVITVADIHCSEVDIELCGNKDEKGPINFPKNEDNIMNKKPSKQKLTNKTALIQSSAELKHLAGQLLQEEYKMKIMFQERELEHQRVRQQLEIDILLIEKEKKLLELELLKKK